MRRGLSSVRGLVFVVLVMLVVALVALVLVYAAVTHDRELPSTVLRYVLAPLVSLPIGGALLHWLGERGARCTSSRVPELGVARVETPMEGDGPVPRRSPARVARRAPRR